MRDNNKQSIATAYRNALRQFSRLSIIGLAVLFIVPPLPVKISAQESPLSVDGESLLAVKGDPLLQSVLRAARHDRATEKSNFPKPEVDVGSQRPISEVESLSRIAAVERLPGGVTNISLTVRLTGNSVAELLAAGFAIGARVGDVATLETDVTRLPELAALSSVRNISASTYSYPTNDLGRQAVGVDDSSGLRQVTQTGRGVIVGMIDTGIDFRHLDFTVPGTGGKQTRVKALLDMTIYSQQSSDWNYVLPGSSAPIGHVYSEADINAALQLPATQDQNSDIVKERDKHGHGTLTAGIAAGNGLAGPQPGKYAGMAPEADLVIAKVSRDNTGSGGIGDADIINAMKFIQQMAAERGQPFVINMSLGTNVGSHDGTMNQERAIDQLVNSGPGRAFCIATGNYGHMDVHASGNLPGGTATPLSVSVNAGSSPQFFGFAYRRSDSLSVTLVRPDGQSIGPVPYTNNPVPFSNQYVDVYNSVDDKRDGDPQNDQKAVAIFFKSPASNIGSGATRTWTVLIETGSIIDGHFDAWIETGRFTNFVDGSRRLSSTATSQGAITVGGFVTRPGNFGTVGDYASYTGVGPTADGREKPDVTSPSSFIYSSNSSVGTGLGAPFAPDSGFHVGAHGTSVSSPVVAGAVALLLQANPNFTTEQIKNLLRATSTHDSFTGDSLWSERFGAGKLNVGEALRSIPPSGNSIDETRFFVTQQYLDFLRRFPESPGLQFYLDILNGCHTSDAECIRYTRGALAANFFRSPEFQAKGAYIMYLYMVAIGQRPVTAAELPTSNDPNRNNRPHYAEFMTDMAAVTSPDDRNGPDPAKKAALTNAFVQRPEIVAYYPTNTYPTVVSFGNALANTAGVTLSSSTQNAIAAASSRAQVLQIVAESAEVNARFYKPAFVTMEYFGYLRREREDCHDPANYFGTGDPNSCGYIFHNNRFNLSDNADLIQNIIVRGFIESPEYRNRFGP